MTDWKAGDDALCIKTRHPNFKGESRKLKRGSKYKVVETYLSSDPRILPGEIALVLAGVTPNLGPGYGYPSSLFIKISPDAELIAQERREQVPA